MTELEIEAFLTIVKMGNITAAAEALYVTQPALSRRMRALEDELGFSLMQRNKGVRIIELTHEGKAFIAVAEKWKAVWKEARDILKFDQNNVLNIASIGSVSTYILPSVFRQFLQKNPDYKLSFHNYHSFESYGHVESGTIDIALISDDMYAKSVETIPIFKEAMQLVTGKGSNYPEIVHPSQLDAEREVRLPWNPEYDLWHEYWFGIMPHPRVFLDQMSLMEEFLRHEDTWAIVPASAAHQLVKRVDAVIHDMSESPPDRIIYYLTGKMKKPKITQSFLDILNSELENIEEIESYLH